MTPILVLLLLNLSMKAHCATYNEASTLLNSLLSNYDKNLVPVVDQNSPLEVSLGIGLFSISQLDEVRQVISLSGYFILTWTDELFVWNASDHHGITKLNPGMHHVWIPVPGLASTVSGVRTLTDISIDTGITISNTGYAYWIYPVTLETPCKMIMTKFPYDTQTCSFQIFPNTYTDDQVVMLPLFDEPVMSSYIPSGEWELVSSSLQNATFSIINTSTSFIEFSLKVQRKPVFFVVNLLFPTCALSFLNILVFILPADSGEKVSFSITVLLSVMLFMGVSTEVLPPTSEVVPLITQYLTALTTISILSVIATVIILIYHHQQEKNDKRKNLVLSVLGRMKQNLVTKGAKTPKTQPKPSTVSPINIGVLHKGQVADDSCNENNTSNTYTGGVANFCTAISKTNDDLCISVDDQEGQFVKHKEAPEQDKKPTVINMWASRGQICDNSQEEKAQPSRIKGGWCRFFDNQEKVSERVCSNKEKSPPPSYTPNKEKSGAFISKNLDSIFFIVFLFVWVTITFVYMVALFS